MDSVSDYRVVISWFGHLNTEDSVLSRFTSVLQTNDCQISRIVILDDHRRRRGGAWDYVGDGTGDTREGNSQSLVGFEKRVVVGIEYDTSGRASALITTVWLAASVTPE